MTYELGAHWFGPAAGVVAGVRDPHPHPGAELRRARLRRHPVRRARARARSSPRRAARTRAACCVLLALAGLLRPEAWCFSLVYVAWKRDARLLPCARRGARDLDGSTTSSWPATRCTRCSTPGQRGGLQRITGLDDVPLTVPRRLGEILREPGLLGAAAGGLLVLAFMRRKAALPIAAGFVSHRRVLRARGGRPADPRPLPAAARRAARGLLRRGRVRLARAARRPPLAHPLGGDRRAWCSSPSRSSPPARPTRIGRPAQRDAHAERTSSPTCTRSATRSRAARSRCRTTARSRTSRCGRASRRAEIVSAQLEQPTRGSYIDPASERVRAQLHARPAATRRRLTATRPGQGFAARLASRTALWSRSMRECCEEKWTVHPLSKSASRDCPPH